QTVLDHAGVRLTIDTREDFETAAALYDTLGAASPDQLFAYIDAHPAIREKMKRQILNNSK
ncbi:MAG: hypothetical protein II383_04460, partial [Bacteroidales bacterium]|nr:hypothetical protein [Bacteroidales bacterium]